MKQPKPKPHNFYWTKDQCLAEAKKHKIISHFKLASPSAYRSAKNNGWLAEIRSNMEAPKKPKGYWNFENCKKAAEYAETLSEFSKNHGAYQKSLSEGWIDFFDLKTTRQRPNYWSFELLLNLVEKYETQADFRKDNANAYQAAVKKGYWPQLKELLHATKILWNYDKCKMEASNFYSREAFRANAPGAYGYAYKNIFLDEICAHMSDRAASFGECAIEEFLNSCNIGYQKQKKFPELPSKYRFDFYLPDFNLLIEHHGSQHEKLGWGKTYEEKLEHLNGIKKRDATKVQFAKDEAIILLVIWQREYKGIAALQKLLEERMRLMLGHFNLIKKDLSKSQRDLIWRKKTTFDYCQLEANKYLNRKAFKVGSPYFYKFAKDNDWYDRICAHMKRPKPKNYKWDRNACEIVALTCKSKVEFKKFPGARAAAIKYGWYDELCTHMIRPRAHNFKGKRC